MQHPSGSINELWEAFFSLKRNKIPGYHEISFKVIKKCSSKLCEPLKHVFNLSIQTGVFPDKLKINRVSPVYKAGNSSDRTICRPISALPCFSKNLERIMYNRLFSYVSQKEILYSKQFGFQSVHLTEHAKLMNLLKIICKLKGVSTDLAKAFDNVNHSIIVNILGISMEKILNGLKVN